MTASVSPSPFPAHWAKLFLLSEKGHAHVTCEERKVLFTYRLAGDTVSVSQVCDLHQGKTYVFRVRAVNASGVGRPSDVSEPVLVEARPGET